MATKAHIRCLWKKLLSFTIALAITLSISLITQKPITAHANYDIGLIIDALGLSGSGGSSRINNGISYARTGYLCYLLTADGNTIPGMTAQAFYSPGFNALSGSGWYCHSKKGGYSATSWKAAAPWNLPPFNENKSTNVGLIRQWMATPVGNSCNAIYFVTNNWGLEIAEKFATGDYVLVIETILHFQPSVKSGGGSSFTPESISYRDLRAALVDLGYIGEDIINKIPDSIIETLRYEVWRKAKELGLGGGGGYQTVGSPVIGTCSDCIAYENAVGGQPSIFASYTNKIACFAEHITKGGPGEKAGFIPWTGTIPTLLSDSEVSTYGVAMMVIKAQNDAQTTCDEPQIPNPHNPPDESDGTKKIIKNYRTRNLTTNTLTEDGNTFTIEQVSSDILIEDEDKYVVVGWATSSGTSFIPSPTWESSI